MIGVYPLLTPQGIDPSHPFPFISNLSVNMLVVTRYADSDHCYCSPPLVVPTDFNELLHFHLEQPRPFRLMVVHGPKGIGVC
jgi:polyphosphate kinase